jgi:hypothetical protein
MLLHVAALDRGLRRQKERRVQRSLCTATGCESNRRARETSGERERPTVLITPRCQPYSSR